MGRCRWREIYDDWYLTSISRKAICDKLSGGSSGDLYTCCRMNFTADPIQIQTPKFVDLGFSTINALDEVSDRITLSTRILRPIDGAHWSAPNQIFGGTTAIGVSEAKSDCNYNYKNVFLIWKSK